MTHKCVYCTRVCVCVGCLVADMTWRVVTGWHALRNAFISATHALPQSCHWCRCSFIWHLKSASVSVCVSVCACARVRMITTCQKAAVPQLSVEKCVGVQREGSCSGAEREKERVPEWTMQSLWDSSYTVLCPSLHSRLPSLPHSTHARLMWQLQMWSADISHLNYKHISHTT